MRGRYVYADHTQACDVEHYTHVRQDYCVGGVIQLKDVSGRLEILFLIPFMVYGHECILEGRRNASSVLH